MYKLLPVKAIKLSFLFVLIFSFNLSGQKTINLDTIGDIIYLGKFKLSPPSSFKSEYTYDPFTDKYIYSTRAGEIEIGTPLVLTPQQYRLMIRKSNIQNYFREKLKILEEEDSDDTKKIRNLLPDLYLNSNFFHNNVEYTSDSNGYWRFRSWDELLLEKHKVIQVLTHPIWWFPKNEFPPFETVVKNLIERFDVGLDAYLNIFSGQDVRINMSALGELLVSLNKINDPEIL